MKNRDGFVQPPAQFYDDLAPDYDLMTGRAGGTDRLRTSLEKFVTATGIESAVDAGCGTGKHAIALAQLGLRVAGIDVSPEMIARARELGRSSGVEVDWYVGELTDLDRLVGTGWDAVLCLGNTLPHLLRVADLRRFARAALRALGRPGLLAVQCLNYPLLRERSERIVAITKHGQREFIRFNDYTGRNVWFNLLRIDWTDAGARHRLSSTVLRPWTPAELQRVFETSGFQQIHVYGGLDLSPFDPRSSRSFLMVAKA